MIPREVYGVLNGIWPMVIIFSIVVSVVRIASLTSHGKKVIIYKEFFTLIFAIYLLLLFELVSNSDMQSVGNNFQPLKEIMRHATTSPLFYRNVLGNVLLFIPFGLFTSFYIKKNTYWKGFFLTLVTSFTIEVVQSRIGRSFDIDDIILNVIGGLIGVLLFKILKHIGKVMPRFLKSEIVLNILSLIIGLALIIMFLDYTGIWRLLHVFN